jgi:hypothetical protein
MGTGVGIRLSQGFLHSQDLLGISSGRM